MSTSLSPFKQGAVVQVAQGVLRGVGPMGPRGFTGPQGQPGPQGPRGEQPQFEPVSASFSRTEDISITNDGSWQRVLLSATNWSTGSWANRGTGPNEGKVVVQSPSTDGSAAVMTGIAVVAPPGGGSEEFSLEIGIFAGDSPTPFASSVFRHTTASVASTFTFTTQIVVPGVGSSYSIGVRVSDSTVAPTLSHIALRLASTGGPRGVIGQTGPAGPEGPVGPQGPPGSAGGGYVSLIDLDADGTPWDGAGITLNYNEQGLPYPTGTDPVKSVFFHRSMADQVARKAVRRFSSSTEEANADDREIGQVYFQQSTNSVHVLTNDGLGNPQQSVVAQVVWSTDDPPAGVTYPAGTIWMKVV